MRILPLCLIAAVLAAPASAAVKPPEEVLAAALRGRVAGAPVSCISLNRTPHSTIVDDRTILYRGGAVTYVNKLSSSCPGLRPDSALVSRTPSTRLCSGDIVTVIDPPMPGEWGSCSLEEFVPYRKP